MFFAALTPLLPEYADRLELSKTGAGILSGAYAAGALVGAIPGGIAAARWGVRPAVLLGLAGMSATTFAFGIADNVVVLDAARFLQGLASAFSWTGGLAWLVAAAPPARRGELIGAAMGTAIAGALFGPVLGGAASVAGTGWAFGVVAVASVGLAVWAATTPAFPPREPQPLSALFGAGGDRGAGRGPRLRPDRPAHAAPGRPPGLGGGDGDAAVARARLARGRLRRPRSDVVRLLLGARDGAAQRQRRGPRARARIHVRARLARVGARSGRRRRGGGGGLPRGPAEGLPSRAPGG